MGPDAAVNGDFALTNGSIASTNMNTSQPEDEDIDPIWLSSRTARQIYGLCQVEKVSIRYRPSAPTRTQNRQTKGSASLTVDG